MGRIRTVKPELFTHSELFDAEQEAKLPLRLAYIALFTCCDREGRFKWRPRELKLACLPHDDVDFSRVLDALTTRGFVVRYASDYGCIPSFGRHQVINNREKPSEIQAPTETDLVTRAPRVDDACPTPVKGKGREGKGREGEQEGKGTPVADATASREYGDPRINELMAYLKAANGGMMDGAVQVNRNNCHTLIGRLTKSYPDQDAVANIKLLIDRGKADTFHGKNITSFRYLIEHGGKIINTVKGSTVDDRVARAMQFVDTGGGSPDNA
jgi:hypothetical protein